MKKEGLTTIFKLEIVEAVPLEYRCRKHVPCHKVFAPHYPIPPYLERRYKEFLVKADAEEQKYIQQKQKV